eukprot:6188092-Pleurochrysis_carterae.AAC.2
MSLAACILQQPGERCAYCIPSYCPSGVVRVSPSCCFSDSAFLLAPFVKRTAVSLQRSEPCESWSVWANAWKFPTGILDGQIFAH